MFQPVNGTAYLHEGDRVWWVDGNTVRVGLVIDVEARWVEVNPEDEIGELVYGQAFNFHKVQEATVDAVA